MSQGGTRKTMGTDKILFRPVPVPRNGTQALPIEVFPGHGAQIFAQAPAKGYVQTSAHAPVLATKCQRRQIVVEGHLYVIYLF